MDDCRISFSLSVTLDHVREKMNSMGHSKHGESSFFSDCPKGGVCWLELWCGGKSKNEDIKGGVLNQQDSTATTSPCGRRNGVR